MSSAPMSTSSTWKRTPTTPTLSDASAVTVVVFATESRRDGDVIDTVGAVVSLETVTVTDADVALPAWSLATAVRVYEPLDSDVVFQETEYGAVVSSAPMLVVPRLNWTPTTPMLSEAVADSVTVPETDEPSEGAVIETVGATLSGLLTVTVTVADVVLLPAASLPPSR